MSWIKARFGDVVRIAPLALVTGACAAKGEVLVPATTNLSSYEAVWMAEPTLGGQAIEKDIPPVADLIAGGLRNLGYVVSDAEPGIAERARYMVLEWTLANHLGYCGVDLFFTEGTSGDTIFAVHGRSSDGGRALTQWKNAVPLAMEQIPPNYASFAQSPSTDLGRGLEPDHDREASEVSGQLRREGRDIALLIAGNEYEHWPDLQNPLVDARAIGEVLDEIYGFEVHLVENPTRLQVLDSLDYYASRTYSGEDQLLIFMAGHGSFDEQVIQDGYFVAKDTELEEADKYKDTAVKYEFLRRRLASATAKHVLLVLDACYGGTFDEHISQTAARGEDPYELTDPAVYVSRKMQLTTRRYLTSGGKERVPDGRPEEHSPFARLLLETLRGEGGQDGLLTLADIYAKLQRVNPEPRAGEFERNEPGSDFVFVAAPWEP